MTTVGGSSSFNSVEEFCVGERPNKVTRTDPAQPPRAALRPPTLVDAPDTDVTDREAELVAGGRIYEYSKAANPEVSPVPVAVLEAAEHLSGPSRVVPFDLSASLGVTAYPCTSPNLLVSFVRVIGGETVATEAQATSQAFYVIRGKGSSACGEHGAIPWAAGDMVVLPKCDGPCAHAAAAEHGDASLYWVSDAPLLAYLGAAPARPLFAPTVIRREAMLAAVEAISHEPGAQHRNRMGILLGHEATDYATPAAAATGGAARPVAGQEEAPPRAPGEGGGSGTLTLTPTLWSLLNVLPARNVQRPHRHQSVALDLCVYAPPGSSSSSSSSAGGGGGVYTEMGPELDPATGRVKDPVRCFWKTGACFVTPPGWWHSHVNETGEAAWVLPMQDAGLLTYQRALDIRFAPPPADATAAGKAAAAAGLYVKPESGGNDDAAEAAISAK